MSIGIKSTGVVPSNLRAIRAYRNLQAKEVAAKLDIHLNTLYFWESGKYAPKVTDLARLAEVYRCSVDTLIHPNFSVKGIANHA